MPSRLIEFLVRTRNRSSKLVANSGSKPDIDAVRVIEELEIAEQRRAREHVLEEQRLAPAVMADHDVGHEAALAQLHRLAHHRLAVQDAVLVFADVVVDVRRRRARRRVDDLLDARECCCRSALVRNTT